MCLAVELYLSLGRCLFQCLGPENAVYRSSPELLSIPLSSRREEDGGQPAQDVNH